ncbi:MAG: tripartite tricarboxylate transporter TctB family protein [Bacillota bacterium]
MKKGTIIIALLSIMTSVFLYFYTLKLPMPTSPNVPGPAYVPKLYLTLAVVLAATIIISNWISRLPDKDVNWERSPFVIMGIALMLLSVFFINLLGYFIVTFIFIIGMVLLMGGKLTHAFGASFLFLTFIYLVFVKLFHLPLPKGTFF